MNMMNEQIRPTLGDCMFRPRAVALIGASADPTKNNARPQRYLTEAGFEGVIVPINPGRSEIMGVPCYPDLMSVPFDIDHAFIMVPAAAIEDVIEQCGRKGVPVVTIFTAGFAELGPEGLALQERMVAKARASNVRILGPNCIGLINVQGKLPLTANAAVQEEKLNPGPVSVVSQSGSMLGSILTRSAVRGIGFSKLISIGNESDLSVGEMVSLLAKDPDTKVILLFLETIRDGEALAQAAREAFAAGKIVIAYKLGRSALGRRVAASHTGAMVGADELAQAFFRANGILRVETLEALIELPRLIEGHKPPKGRRVGMMTATGGAAAMIVDRLGVYGDAVPEPPVEFREKLAKDGIEISDSPLIDLPMGSSGGGRYTHILSELMASDHCDAVVSVMGSSSRSNPKMVCERVLNAKLGAKPLAVFLAPQADEGLKILHEAGIAGFRTPESCADAVHAYLNWHAPQDGPVLNESELAGARKIAAETADWDERKASALFAALGVPVVETRIISANGDAVELVSGPAAVKCLSPDIAHKSDAGLVALSVAPENVAKVAGDILDRAKKAFPEARLEGVLVQKMEQGLAEVILGYRLDPEVGPVVVLGMGGVTAELRPSISVRIAPVDVTTAHEMITEVPELRKLAGFRNLPEGDLNALAQTIARFSQMAAVGAGITEAEINPLIIKGTGMGVVAVDGLVAH